VLTADDAYQSMVKSAYPLLEKYQMPMSVFVSSEPVDNAGRFGCGIRKMMIQQHHTTVGTQY
jgi:peptidoglycan/xylan/chitin deacetylase (PgdA/CDA1 family)